MSIRAIRYSSSLLCKNARRGRNPCGLRQRLRATVHHPRWQRKITYFYAVDAYIFRNDTNLAKAELSKLGPMTEEIDGETLQLYLDVFGRQLSFSNMQDLVDRILRFSEGEAVRGFTIAHSKPLSTSRSGDNPKAESELDEAISRFRAAAGDGKEMDAYSTDVLASALDLLGSAPRRSHNSSMRQLTCTEGL